MKRKVLREYYELAANELLKTAKGKGFKVIYVDPDASTDSTFNNKDLMKKYGMEYLPYNRYIRNVQGVPKAWGWIIWDGSEQEVYPLIRKFAEEIGSQETPPDNGSNRTVEEVLASIEQLKDVIMKAQASGQVRIDGNGIIANAEEFKKKLAQGVGSRETMEALAELTRFRIEMSKHRGHQIVLAMPAAFKKLFGAQYDEVVRRFLEKEGVKAISELTPSQKRRLDRETKYPDPQGGFKEYIAYDISDLIKGEGAEEFPENNFKWFDADSDETEKEKVLINACIEFGKSIGVKSYEFVPVDSMGGSRGSASISGKVKIVDDKKNHGLLSTVIHETAHQIMHWEVVKTSNPNLKKFYRGGSALRGSEIVEQEAELCAWIVLSGFGYENQQEHFNYLANWGMNVNNCSDVFDSIMKVADFMYEGIMNNLNRQ